MKLEIRDLTIGEYQDHCDECGRDEEECNDELYDFVVGAYCLEPFHLCKECLTEMKRLLHRVEAMQEPDTICLETL